MNNPEVNQTIVSRMSLFQFESISHCICLLLQGGNYATYITLKKISVSCLVEPFILFFLIVIIQILDHCTQCEKSLTTVAALCIMVHWETSPNISKRDLRLFCSVSGLTFFTLICTGASLKTVRLS